MADEPGSPPGAPPGSPPGPTTPDPTLAEVALRHSEEQYRRLFDSHPVAMAVWDPGTLQILALNDAAIRQYGYSRAEAIGNTIDRLVHPDDWGRLVEQLASMPGGLVSGDIFRHVRSDGSELEVEMTGHPLEFEGRPARLIMAMDVSERRQLEAQLRQAQKMEAVGQLAGGIAHDFNNLLTAIRGFTELVRSDLPEGDAHRADLDQVVLAADRATELARQLLAFSRRQVLQPRVVDPAGIVDGISPMLRRLLGEHIEFVTHAVPGLGLIRVDPSQLEQVILNLALNARDAMPDGGQLTIETVNVELDAAYASTHAEVTPGPFMLLAVSDTGTGMAPETQDHAFEPFFTTKGPGKGTGMGLATVFGIVKQSGGSIYLYSEPGEGTTVRIYLPRVDEAPAPASGEPVEVRPAPSGTETILLVEDEPAVRAFAERALAEQGYTVLSAADAPAALALAAAHAGSIELLVTDVVMPGLQGHQLAERLAAERPDLRVLYVSGFTENSVIHHGVLGADISFLPKPFSAEALGRAVRQTVDGTSRNVPRRSKENT